MSDSKTFTLDRCATPPPCTTPGNASTQPRVWGQSWAEPYLLRNIGLHHPEGASADHRRCAHLLKGSASCSFWWKGKPYRLQCLALALSRSHHVPERRTCLCPCELQKVPFLLTSATPKVHQPDSCGHTLLNKLALPTVSVLENPQYPHLTGEEAKVQVLIQVT